MSFQHHVGSFTLRTGTGTQAITGVGFQPKVVIFSSAATSAAADDYAIYFIGMDDGTKAYVRAVETSQGNTPPQASTSASRSTASICRCKANGLIFTTILEAHITTMGTDGFTITVTLNTLSQSEFIEYIAFGGSDLTYEIFTFAPLAVAVQSITGLTLSPKAVISFFGGTFTGEGVGWDQSLTFVSPTNATTLLTGDRSATPTADNSRYLRNGVAFAQSTRRASSVVFTSDGMDIHWSTQVGSSEVYVCLALAGSVLDSDAGVFTCPTSPGTQTVSIAAINPVAVLFGSVGAVASTTVGTGARIAAGFADTTNTGEAAWAGANYGVSTSVAAKGSLTTASVYVGTPANPGSGSAINAKASMTALAANSFTLTHVTVDTPIAVEYMYLALGTAAVPQPTPTGVSYPIRRVRIFTLPSAENYRVFLSRLEFLVQAGVGLTTGQGSDPTFSVEISRDGGKTYGTAYVLSPGKLGEYAHRSFVHRLGQYRNATVRIAMSDPVLWAIVAGWADLEKGLN